jgi:hypothetical protein
MYVSPRARKQTAGSKLFSLIGGGIGDGNKSMVGPRNTFRVDNNNDDDDDDDDD